MAAAFPRPGLITLLTDFGYRDAYVGIMKGVILGLNPHVRLVDLSHGVPPQNLLAGALLLQSAWRYFPPGTIHLAVVDPGVGSGRRALAAAVADQFCVGPDNGLFSLVFRQQPPQTMVSLENPRYFLPEVSSTFHGRDILAPVAAHLSLGVPLTALGPEITDPVSLELPLPRFAATAVHGQVLAWDHFGNLITNIPYQDLQMWLEGRPAQVFVGGTAVPHWATTYSEVPVGELLALAGSHGYLEIAGRDSSALDLLAATTATPVTVYPARSISPKQEGKNS